MTVLSVSGDRGVAVAVVAGEVDAVNADLLRSAVEQAVDEFAAGVVVDLSDVVYLDSAGIHALFTVARRLHERGRHVALVVAPGSPVHDTLRYAGVLDTFDVASTRAEAIGRVMAVG